MTTVATNIDNNTIVCWFESAIADDTHALETLLATHPTLLERIDNASGRSALQHAAAWDAAQAVAVLLSHGADVHRRDPDGFTAVHLAVAVNGVTTLELLMRHLRDRALSSLTSQAPSILPNAPSTTLKEPTPLVDQRCAGGFTALLLAASLGYPKCCAILLDVGGADPLLALDTPPHLTALDLALRGDHRAAAAVETELLVCNDTSSSKQE